MKVGKASKKDFDKMWAIYRAINLLRDSCFASNPELREQRCNKLIVGRVMDLGQGGLIRISMGCDMLIDHCCDPDKSHYDFSPELREALAPYDCAAGE